MRVTIILALLAAYGLAGAGSSRADLAAFLSETRSVAGERFEADLFLLAPAVRVGDAIELINLDIAQSMIKGTPLTEFSRVRFMPAPPFDPWSGDLQFGTTPGFESQIFLDAFATVPAIPYEIADDQPFQVGTFRFDYGGIDLGGGETITLDVRGQDDGSATRTTSVAIRRTGGATELVTPDFTSPWGSNRATYPMVTAIPEPGSMNVLLWATAGFSLRRRRSRPRSGRPA